MALVQIKHRPQAQGFVRGIPSARRRVPRRSLRRYIHGLGTDQPLVAFSGMTTSTGALKYLYADRQGSIIALADSSGTVTQKYSYGPWGEPKDGAGNTTWGGSRFRYTGQTVLPEAQLYYYKARLYDPNYGRFLQTDPIGSKDDLDLYAYTGDDPVNKSDPSGLLTKEQQKFKDDSNEYEASNREEYFQIVIIGPMSLGSCAAFVVSCARAVFLGAATTYTASRTIEDKSDEAAKADVLKGVESGAIQVGPAKIMKSANRAVRGVVLATTAASTTKAQGGSNRDAAAAAAGTFIGELIFGDVGANPVGQIAKSVTKSAIKSKIKVKCTGKNCE